MRLCVIVTRSTWDSDIDQYIQTASLVVFLLSSSIRKTEAKFEPRGYCLGKRATINRRLEAVTTMLNE